MSAAEPDLQEQLARIRQLGADTQNLVEESGKLIAERLKLETERLKLESEGLKLRADGRKLDRDRWIAPWFATTGLIGGIVTVLGLIQRNFGH